MPSDAQEALQKLENIVASHRDMRGRLPISPRKSKRRAAKIARRKNRRRS